MKKCTCLMIAALLIVLLCACSQQPAVPSGDNTPTTATTQPTTQPPATTEPQPSEPVPSDETQPTEETDATEPSSQPSEPVEIPTEPVVTPTEPTITPTEPTTVPTEPTVEPTLPPTEPTTAPTEPAPAPTVHTHSYTATVTKPTCTAGGYTTYTCPCGDKYTDNKTAAAGHNYKAAVTAPTCTAGGYTTYTCSVCGNKYTDNKTSATGHSWSGWSVTKDPTYTATGTKTRSCSGCGATETATIPQLEMTASQMQQEVLRLVNIEREKEGLAPLEYVSSIQGAADTRASEIRQSFSHTRPDGTSCFTVLDEYPISYFSAGENIAYGYRTPEAVVNGWMNSPGHRANILSPDFTGIVIGFEEYYWVQLFIGI